MFLESIARKHRYLNNLKSQYFFMKKCILFIGTDYTSIWAYKQLTSKDMLAQIEDGKIELVFISEQKYHYFHPFSGEVLSGIIPENAIYTPLRHIVKHATVIHGKAVAVSPFTQSVTYINEDGIENDIPYDHLVIGSGIEDSAKTLPEIDKFCISIQKPLGIPNFKKALQNTLQASSKLLPRPQTNIVILGSGLSVTETSIYIAEYIEKEYDKKDIQIYLINTKGKVHKEWGHKHPQLAKYSDKVLAKKGVTIVSHTYAKEITSKGILLSDGSFIDTQIVVHAMARNINPHKGLKHLSMNPFKKIETDPYLNAKGYDNIWCGGDVSLVPKPHSQDFCPPDAMWSIRHGNRIGKNIKKILESKQPEKLGFSGLGHISGLGSSKGAVEMYDLAIWGWTGYLIRMMVLFYFFPARVRLLSIWWQYATRRRKAGANSGKTSSRFPAEQKSSIPAMSSETLHAYHIKS